MKWIFSYSRCSLIRLKSISFLPVRLSPCCFRYTLHWSIFNLSNLPSTAILMNTLLKFKKCEKIINFMVQQKCETINNNLCKMMFKLGQVGSLSHTQTPTAVSAWASQIQCWYNLLVLFWSFSLPFISFSTASKLFESPSCSPFSMILQIEMALSSFSTKR